MAVALPPPLKSAELAKYPALVAASPALLTRLKEFETAANAANPASVESLTSFKSHFPPLLTALKDALTKAKAAKPPLAVAINHLTAADKAAQTLQSQNDHALAALKAHAEHVRLESRQLELFKQTIVKPMAIAEAAQTRATTYPKLAAAGANKIRDLAAKAKPLTNPADIRALNQQAFAELTHIRKLSADALKNNNDLLSHADAAAALTALASPPVFRDPFARSELAAFLKGPYPPLLPAAKKACMDAWQLVGHHLQSAAKLYEEIVAHPRAK